MSYTRAHALLFLGPLLLIVLLMYGMMGWTVVISMDDWVGLAPVWKFAGLQNFRVLISGALHERFLSSLRNNLTWLVVFIVPAAFLGLILAYGLDLIGGAERIFRPLFLYPMALSFVVTGTVWAWMYDPDAGIINGVLRSVGLGRLAQPWIADPQLATYCLIGAAIWQYTGFAMTLYLAAIRDLSREMIEAARVDGATDLQVFRHVVVPNVGHATMIVMAMLILFTLKVFDLVWVMTFGGPGISTEVLPFFMFVATYRQQFVGIGAAISVIILILAVIVVVPYALWSMKRLQV
jgi:ABC-type sugar transport system permease subunit